MEKLRPFWEAIFRFWKRKHLTQILLLTFLVFILLSILYFAFLASRANVQQLKDGLSQATVIYDKDGDEASKLGTNRTSGATIENIPPHVKNAVIAIEDERFYEHNGFDIKGITRAFFQNLFAGRITSGGSTITQQLTKNALLSPERTYKRKAEELFLAVEIEKTYKKDEILQMYLNQVYFGSGSWGISNASKRYFNKDIQEVSISEGALLAGLLQAPSRLDPYKNLDGAIKRRNLVLNKMQELNMITAEQLQAAKQDSITLMDGGGSFVDRKYPYYIDAILDEASTKYGLTQEEILTKGYTIYTELDQNLQSALENVYERDTLFPRGKSKVLVQSGAVLLDPKTGGVRGLVGGRGDHVFRGFNRAIHLKAQPGSTIKPLAVYTPALEKDYHYSSMLIDEKLTFGEYQPENYSKTYQGEVEMYKAVEDSLNLPAVWLLNEIGLEKGIHSLKRFGIPLDEKDQHLAIALGGMHKGISPLQLAEAYSAFPNGGKRNDSYLISKIVSPTGKVIAEHKRKTVKVTSKTTANEMTSMLLNVVESGTGSGTNIPGLQIAGKTGSTQLPYEDINGTKDQWFVGYTPNLVGAVWLGYDKTDREHYLSTSSSKTIVPIFRAIMEQASPYIEKESFEVDSVNKRLSEQSVTTEELLEKAEEYERKVREEAEKLREVIKEEAPKWQAVWEEILKDFKELKERWEERQSQ